MMILLISLIIRSSNDKDSGAENLSQEAIDALRRVGSTLDGPVLTLQGF